MVARKSVTWCVEARLASTTTIFIKRHGARSQATDTEPVRKRVRTCVCTLEQDYERGGEGDNPSVPIGLRNSRAVRTRTCTRVRAEYTLECAGGGRIEHVPSAGRIFVYGYSMGYGRANHEIAVALLREAYPTYADITYSNDGY
ncbi:hypothetical protein EON66_06480 [archaeon]|nr:MAG: hypothetical protein EON66_06480 [archaeon]